LREGQRTREQDEGFERGCRRNLRIGNLAALGLSNHGILNIIKT